MGGASKGKKVLLIEDEPENGELEKEFLEEEGYLVDWFVGAELNSQGELILTCLDGSKTPFLPGQYDIALVDGTLQGSPFQGWDITPRLVAAGLIVIGISNNDDTNDELLRAGATDAFNKLQLFSGNRIGRLDTYFHSTST